MKTWLDLLIDFGGDSRRELALLSLMLLAALDSEDEAVIGNLACNSVDVHLAASTLDWAGIVPNAQHVYEEVQRRCGF